MSRYLAPVAAGLVFIAAGTAFLLDALEVITLVWVGDLIAPVVLILLGLALLAGHFSGGGGGHGRHT